MGQPDDNAKGARTVSVLRADDVQLRGWLGELWRYRELAWALAERDIRVRYRQAVIGAAWAVLQPAAMMVIFTIFFGRLAQVPSDGIPYPVFVFAGLLPWLFFAGAASAASNALVNQSAMVAKVYFPRLLLPGASLGAYFIDLFVSAVLLIALMLAYGFWPGLTVLWVPEALVGIVICTLAVGIFFSALLVRYRDVRYVLPFLLQLWMFVTPVIYPVSFIPEDWQWLVWLNPMSGFVSAIRTALFDTPLEPAGVAVSTVVACVLLTFAVWYFRRVERALADFI